jgi:hypothetical protein
MERPAAVKIIKDTFESSFDKGRFINLSKNLVKYLDSSKNFTYQGNIIPDAYEQSIQTLERIGKYEDSDGNKIDVLIVRLKKEHSLERARTMQRNFVAWYLNGSRGGELKDAALVAFVSPGSTDWRFSLVRMDYSLVESSSGKVKVETELTPARRYSYLVGENESSHTAQVQLLPILENDKGKPLLSDFERAFSIEVVTREFFTKYRDLFHEVEEALQKLLRQNEKIRGDFAAKSVDTVNFAKKLLGQVVFLYFLQKKGWFGVGRDEDWGTGPKDFLRRLFEKKVVPYSNFFNDVLEPLFYEALAVERTDDFYSRFNCKIPFLNGGLFDPINNYDWVHTDILLPNELFSNNEKTKEGDTGTGILDVFDRYNFTVKEDEPLDKEVAVDPEMLGKVFENLLEVKDRKSKGTYYTPREIVHYMCQESLINYLDTAINTGDVPLVSTPPPQGKLFGKPDPEQGALKTPGYRMILPREDIETFVRMGELAIEHDETAVKKLGQIQQGKIKSTEYKIKLKSIQDNAQKIDDALAKIRVCDPAIGSGAFPVGLMTEIVRARNTLSTYLPRDKTRTNYHFKRHAIQNCLYGVDIDPGAVEIAKLRLWLSLVVDEEDIKQIQPLPNLDYKIVCGNSLLGVKKDVLNWPLFEELERLKPLYFNETNAKKKQEYKKQINQFIKEITNDKETFDFEVYFSEVFHEKGGFDVVIANPPHGAGLDSKTIEYVAHSDLLMKGNQNSAILFTKKGLLLTRPQGTITYVIPKSFCYSDSWEAARLLLYKELLVLLDVSMGFENVLLEQVVFVAKREETISTLVTGKMLLGGIIVNHSFIDKTTYNLFGIYVTGLRNEELKIGHKIRNGNATFAKVCTIKRGLDIQDHLTEYKWDVDIFRCKSIGRYILKPATEGLTVKKARLLDNKIDYMRTPKIIIQNIIAHVTKPYEHIIMMATIDTKGVICLGSVGNIFATDYSYSLEYLTALLNSNLVSWYAYHFIYGNAIRTMRFDNYHLAKLPLVELSRVRQKPFIDLVNQILIITKDEDYLSNPTKQARVKELERQIDQTVYELYGLTPEEVAVVEGYDRR